MTMRNFIVQFLWICCVLMSSVKTDDCRSPDIPDPGLNSFVNPNNISLKYDGKIATFRMENTEKILNKKNNKYIDAELDTNKNLTIFTTDEFKNYAKEESATKIVLTITFQCTGQSQNKILLFYQNFDDSNEYDPEFSQNEYNFSLPLPLYQGFDLTLFKSISAIDYDLFGNEITFTSSDATIVDVETKHATGSDTGNKKSYYASLKLNKPLLNITNDIKFTIKATDSGKPSRSSYANVILSVNSSNTLPQQPNFEKALYEGNLNKNFELIIEDVALEKGTFTDKDNLIFMKDKSEDSDLFTIQSNVEEGRVKINLVKNLTENDVKGKSILSFVLIARNPRASADGRTGIVVKIPSNSSEEKPTTSVAVNKTLLVLHMDEGKPHENFLEMVQDNCFFTINSSEPNDKEYFTIDVNTHKMSSIKLDREDKIFADMIVPQIQLNLTLICPDQKEFYIRNNYQNVKSSMSNLQIRNTQSSGTTNFGKRSYVLTDDINYSSRNMIMNVILEDINDNPPEFIFPPFESFIVGYPEAKIANVFLNKTLIQIQATDKDAGLNSKIKYAISSNNHFDIEPETGIVFPFVNALVNVDQITLTVYASDRNGAQDGNKISRNITIMRLTSSDVVMLTFSNGKFDSFDEIFGVIRNKTKLDFRILTHGIVPSQLPNTKSLFQSLQTVLKVWVYAFDTNKQLMQGEEIKRKISEISHEFGVTASIYDDEINKNYDPNSNSGSSVSYLAAIIILSITLFAFAGFMIWWIFIRRRINNNNGKISTNECDASIASTTTSVTADGNGGSLKQSPELMSIRPKYTDHNNYENEVHVMKNDSIQSTTVGMITENLADSSNFNQQKQLAECLQGKLNEYNDTENKIKDENNETEITAQNNRRKSTVTFNELVKKIDVEDDADDDDSISDTVRIVKF